MAHRERGRRPPDRRQPSRPPRQLIAGIHAVGEALSSGEAIEAVIIAAHRGDDPAVARIVSAAETAGIPVRREDERFFRALGAVRHQHVAAYAAPFAYARWEDVRAAIRAKADALVVVVDHIEDPQNLGAVIRNAECAGASAVVIPDRRGSPVTPAVRRASAGATSHIKVVAVPNLVRAIGDLKADGCWVYGLAGAPGAERYTAADFTGKCAIVVGAEGKGLSRLIATACDRILAIPLQGKVASLNAASAAAVALFEAVRQRSGA